MHATSRDFLNNKHSDRLAVNRTTNTVAHKGQTEQPFGQMIYTRQKKKKNAAMVQLEELMLGRVERETPPRCRDAVVVATRCLPNFRILTTIFRVLLL